MALLLAAERLGATQGTRQSGSHHCDIDAGQQAVDQSGGNVIRAKVVARHIALPLQQGIAAARDHQRHHNAGRITLARADDARQRQQQRHDGDGHQCGRHPRRQLIERPAADFEDIDAERADKGGARRSAAVQLMRGELSPTGQQPERAQHKAEQPEHQAQNANGQQYPDREQPGSGHALSLLA